MFRSSKFCRDRATLYNAGNIHSRLADNRRDGDSGDDNNLLSLHTVAPGESGTAAEEPKIHGSTAAAATPGREGIPSCLML
jgi:hypothetical protein